MAAKCLTVKSGSTEDGAGQSPAEAARAPMSMVDDYLAELPHGLDSYPEAQCKASVINIFVRQHRERLVEVLEGPPRDLVLSPKPDSMWVPEVHAAAVFCAQCEHIIGGPEAYIAFAEEENYRLVSSPLYRVMFRIFSPLRAGRLISSGYARFHQGASSAVVASTATSFDVRAEFPAKLFPAWLSHAQFTGAVAALRAGGTGGATLDMLETSPTHALARITHG